MDVVEEVAGVPPASPTITVDLSPVAKGKRTKRQRIHSPVRIHSPIPFTALPTTIIDTSNNQQHLITTTSSSSADNSTTTEEEDTARCLILLSQGHSLPNPNNMYNRGSTYQDYQHRQVPKQKMYTTTKPSTCMYTCKTCNRSFSSFQALGGHRTSHKKPKNDKKYAVLSDDENFPSRSSFRDRISSNNALSLQLSNINTFSSVPKPSAPSPRIHECSYCGAEFNSGQALGGHMRRHRGGPISPSMNPNLGTPSPRNVLSLDLNLPAPDDETHRFGILAPAVEKSGQERQQNEEGEGMKTTTRALLVDCHNC